MSSRLFLYFRGLLIYLLVREVFNRLQRYGKVFKLPKNYVIIFENQAKLMLESVEQFFTMLYKCWANKLAVFLILLIINLLCFSINLLPRDDPEKYRFVQQLFLLFLVHLTDGVTLLPLLGVTHRFIVLRALPWAMRCCPCWA